MARQAEAERERRAKIINAEGEFQAAENAAARSIGEHPAALQLRYLQTLLEVGSDHNSTIVFPLPLDVLEPFLDRLGDGRPPSAPGRPSATRLSTPGARSWLIPIARAPGDV